MTPRLEQSRRLVQSETAYNLVGRQLSALIRQYGLQDDGRQIRDAYEAICRESLAYPLGRRPATYSTINHDGTPFQYALTLGPPGRVLAFLGEAGPLDAAGRERMRASHRCMATLARGLGAEASLMAVEELLESMAPAADAELLAEPAGAFWIGAGFSPSSAPRLKIYINGRWGDQRERWRRLRHFATFFGMDRAWRELEDGPVSHLQPLGTAITLSSEGLPGGRIYLSAYGKRISYYKRLARISGQRLLSQRLHVFAQCLLADEIDYPTQTTVASFGLGSGPELDFKFELCAHCLFDSDVAAANRLCAYFSATGVDSAAYDELLAVLAPAGLSGRAAQLHCYAGIGQKRGTTYMSVYLKPDTMTHAG